MKRIFTLLFLIFIASFSNAQDFVTHKGQQFELNGTPYYYVGTNYWYGNLLSLQKDPDRGINRLRSELDFLKSKQPFIQSTYKLAEAISGFTGEKTETIQSYINPMNDSTNLQKNNPMTKQKTVSKVNQRLISIGFNPPK